MHPYIHLGPLTIASYYLVISLGVTIAMLWFLRRARRLELPPLIAIDLCFVTLIGGFIGARLLHIFYEEPQFYFEHPLRMLEFWYGGFVYLGGVVGSGLAVFAFCIYKREAFTLWADVASIPASFAYAVGRLGCFLNGCCYGKQCFLPWAVFMDSGLRHPTQLYASFWEFGVLGILILTQRKMRSSGSLFALGLVLSGPGRMLMEHFRDDNRGDMIAGLSLGTWMSFLLAAAGMLFLLTRPRRLGA